MKPRWCRKRRGVSLHLGLGDPCSWIVNCIQLNCRILTPLNLTICTSAITLTESSEDFAEMAHDPIASALQRLDEIRAEISTLQAEANEIERALSVMRRFTAIPGRALSETQGAAELTIEQTYRQAAALGFQNMGQAEFEVLAKKALNEVGRPMTRTLLLQWLEGNGTPLGGADASKNVGTKLWRARDTLINIRGAGYWFRDRPCPAVGYMPTITSAQVFEREEGAAVADLEDDDDEAA